MKEPKIADLKKYLNGIIKANKKYVTSERLSRIVGIYPEVINEQLSFFLPTLKMDPEYNLLELVPTIKKYIADKEEEHSQTLIKKAAHKKIAVNYSSIGDFVYKKMTVAGGLINKNAELTSEDLRVLKKLVSEEQARRKK